MTSEYTLREIAAHLKAELRGDADARVYSLNTLQDAKAGDLAFLANPKYARYLEECQATAVIVHPAQADQYSGNCLILENPYAGYAQISSWFDTAPKIPSGVHPSAVVSGSANVAASACIAANAVVEDGAMIGEHTVIGAGSVVGAGCVIGSHCRLAANVTLYHGVTLGDRVTIHSGSVIGADGFGFAPTPAGWQKIHQIGGVVIGNNVEIGACTTIDRGALGDTKIGNGVIIDNHVQIAHNAEIGDNTAMAAYSAVAGSAIVGKNCVFAGDVGIVGHITIADGVQVTAKTLVTASITEQGSYSSGTPFMPSKEWRKSAVRFSQLDQLARSVKKLEKN